MRLLLAGTLATLTAAGLAAIRPAVLTDEETGGGERDPREPDARRRPLPLERPARGARARARAGTASPAPTSRRASRRSASSRALRRLWEQPFDLVGVTASCPPATARVRGERGRGPALPRRTTSPFSGVQAREARARRRRDRLRRATASWPPSTAGTTTRARTCGASVLLFLNNDPEADPRALRREAPPLLRPLGLQVRDGGRGSAPRARSSSTPTPRPATGGRSSRPPGRASSSRLPASPGEPALAGEGLGDGGGGPAHRPPRRPRPRRAARRGRDGATSARCRSACGSSLALEERGLAPHERERGRPPARPRPRAREARRSSTPPTTTTRREAGPVGRDGRLQRRARQRLRRRRPARRSPRPSRRCPSGRAARSCSRRWPRRSRACSARSYLARHPPVPAGRLAANINIDGVNIWGRTRDVPVIGLGKSSLDDWIRAIAEAQGAGRGPGGLPGQGRLLPLGPPQLRPRRRARRLPRRRHGGRRQAARAGGARGSRSGRRRTTTSRRTTSPPTGTSRARSRTRGCSSYLGVEGGGRPARAGVAAGRRVRGRPPEGARRARRLGVRALWLEDQSLRLRDDLPSPVPRRARRSCGCASPASATPTSSSCAATTPTRACPATSSWAWSRRRRRRPSGSAAAWSARSTPPAARARPAAPAAAPTASGAPCSASSPATAPSPPTCACRSANLHAVPDGMPDEVAVFAEPTAAALELQEQVRVAPGDRVVVIGAGKLGNLVAQTLAATGCRCSSSAAARARSPSSPPAGSRTATADGDRAAPGRPRRGVHGQPRRPRARPPRRAPARHDRAQEHLPREGRDRHGALRGGRDHARRLALRAVRPGARALARGRRGPAAHSSRPATRSRDAVAAFDHAARPGALKVLVVDKCAVCELRGDSSAGLADWTTSPSWSSCCARRREARAERASRSAAAPRSAQCPARSVHPAPERRCPGANGR